METYEAQPDGSIVKTETVSAADLEDLLDRTKSALADLQQRKKEFNDNIDTQIAEAQATIDKLSPVVEQAAKLALALDAEGAMGGRPLT